MSLGTGAKTTQFALICGKLGARARQRGEFDLAGDPIWSVDEWQSFCRAVKEFGRWLPGHFGTSAIATMFEVEEMLEDEYDAVSIHNVLKALHISYSNRALETTRPLYGLPTG